MTGPDRLGAELDRLRRENEALTAELAALRRRLAASGTAAERADARERESEVARVETAAAHAGALAAGRAELATSEAEGERLRGDNAELEASRAALARSEAYVRAVLESSTDYAIIAADLGGRITEWNAGARAVMGWERDEALGRAAAELFYTPEDRGAGVPEREMRTALAEGRATDERWHMRRDGSRFWAVGMMTPLRDGAGAAIGCLKVLSDRTEQRRAEEAVQRLNETLEARVAERTAELRRAVDALHAEALERTRAEDALRQAQKMEAVGQLTGGLAHDFNNMLQAIGGALELAQGRMGQGRAAEAARLVEVARETVERAAALTHRLLAFARRQVLQPRAVEPDELVEGMEELIRRTVGPGIAVELHLHDGIWSVLCDPSQLESALLNLAVNARDAMPGSGRLTIRTADVRLGEADVAGQNGAGPGEYVEVAVGDTGAGMDEATRARAFEPFFTTKPIGQGTGLGLSQLYGFARQSGGFVRLDSAPGRGTTARLYLPRHHAPAGEQAGVGRQPGTAADEPDAAGNGETVLLVEDEAGVRAVAAERLRELGYSVLEAADGPTALRVLHDGRGSRVDALVIDVGLPGGLNGRQVAEMARERRPGLPVLFITGYAGSALEGHLAPGMAVIGKPFTLDALASRIRGMIKGGDAPGTGAKAAEAPPGNGVSAPEAP